MLSTDCRLQIHLSEDEKSTLSKWQRGDELLYSEFRGIFQNRVKEYGLERMEKVGKFKHYDFNISTNIFH